MLQISEESYAVGGGGWAGEIGTRFRYICLWTSKKGVDLLATGQKKSP